MLKRGILVFLLVMGSVYALSGDFDNDGEVDFEDFLGFARHYNENQINDSNREFNLNEDGRIDFSDFLIFAASMGKIPIDIHEIGLDAQGLPVGDVMQDVPENSGAIVSCGTGVITAVKAVFYCPDGRKMDCKLQSGGIGSSEAEAVFRNRAYACGGDPCFGTFKRGRLAADCSLLQNDLNEDGCVNENDLEFGDDELNTFYQSIPEVFGGEQDGIEFINYPVDPDLNAKMPELVEKYDLNGDGLIYTQGPVLDDDGETIGFRTGMAPRDKEAFRASANINQCTTRICNTYTDEVERLKCYVVVGSNNLDENPCNNILMMNLPGKETWNEICLAKIAVGKELE